MTDQQAAVIYETDHYDIFEHPHTARDIRPGMVRTISKTMELRGFWPGKAIIVKLNGDGKYNIMDGNHRFLAAKKAGIPVKYIVDANFTLGDVIDSNSQLSNWQSRDYLRHYSAAGYPEYSYLRLYLKNNPHIPISFAIYVVGVKRGSGPTKRFRNGVWEMDTTFANQFAPVMKDYHQLVPVVAKLQRFNFAVGRIMRTGRYDHKKMMHKLSYLRRRVHTCADVQEYVDMLEEIYNYRTRIKNRVSFQ